MSPDPADHVLAFLLAVGLPVFAAVSYPALVRLIRAGRADARRRGYLVTMVMQWALAAAAVAAWLAAGRAPAGLGLALPPGLPSLGGAAFTALALWLMLAQHRAVMRRGAAGLAELRAQFAPIADVIPRTPREYRTFQHLSLTAGVCEELLYRGFLIWYLGGWLGAWGGAAAATAIFGAAHFYQGARGMLQSGGIGALAAALYLLTGSLVWPIMLHAAVDLQGAAIAHRVMTSGDD